MGARPFTDTLRDLRGGEVLDELSAKLNEVVGAVTTTGKEGKVTLTLKLKPMNNGAMLQIDDDITASVPKPATGGTVMFPTPENNLSRRDPRQPDLPGVMVVENKDRAVAHG